MKAYSHSLFTFLLLVTASQLAYARCECSSKGWVSGCTATINRDGAGVLVTSSSTQCSRVDWYMGQAPQVSVFWGGKEWEPASSWSGKESLSIESCRVCRDEKASDPAARTPRQIFPDSPQPAATSQESACDVFLERVAALGMNVNLENAEAYYQSMGALCGGMEACMQKIHECSK